MKTTDAVKKIQQEMKRDPDFRNAYFSTITLAFKDEATKYRRKTGKRSLSKEDIKKIADKAANYFLDLFCDEIIYPEGR